MLDIGVATRVFRERFMVAIGVLRRIETVRRLRVEDAAQWHTALECVERVVVLLFLDSLADMKLTALAQRANRELKHLHERGRLFTAMRRWIVRLDAFALEDTAEVAAGQEQSQ